MNTLIVTAGYSIFDAKGQLNGFLAHMTEKNLSAKGHKIKYSDNIKGDGGNKSCSIFYLCCPPESTGIGQTAALIYNISTPD